MGIEAVNMGLWRAISRTTLGPGDHVVAHILDPIAGYSNRDLRVGTDIDADTVRRLGDQGAVYIVVAYGNGEPTVNVCTRAAWLRAQTKQTHDDRVVDAAVWRKREELKIG
jgi:hypothetical protein